MTAMLRAGQQRLSPEHAVLQVMQYMAWKEGMDIAVRHIVQRDLPVFVRAAAPAAAGAVAAGAAAGAPLDPAAGAGPPAAPGARADAGGALANGAAARGAADVAQAPLEVPEVPAVGAAAVAAVGAKRRREEGAAEPAGRLPDGAGAPAEKSGAASAAAELLAQRTAKALRSSGSEALQGADAGTAGGDRDRKPPPGPAGLGGPSAAGSKGAGPESKQARGDSTDGETSTASRARAELALEDIDGAAQVQTWWL